MVDPSPPIDALQDVAVPLGGTDSETPLDDAAAAALRETIGNADLVALGETAHGARAQFRLKHRLIRFLVEETGIRAFALEEDCNWVRQVDDYVAHGDGDAETLLRHARINWPWKTAELVELFDWMRSFNEDRPLEDQLRVYGFDTSSFERAADALSTFFDGVDADVPGVRDRVAALAGEDRDEAADAAAWLVDALPSLFDARDDEWADRSSARAVAFARRQSTLLEQALELANGDGPGGLGPRDEAMAANASWIVEDGGADRAVLWAHNVHVARSERSAGMDDVSPTMGDWLADRHGDDYVPIGVGLGGGEYLAMDAETMGPAMPTVPEPPAGSIPDAFSRLDAETPFVSTAALRDREPIADWLDSTPERHRISGMVKDGESLSYVPSDLAAFDGFAFVERTEPTRHLGIDQ